MKEVGRVVKQRADYPTGRSSPLLLRAGAWERKVSFWRSMDVRKGR